MTERIDADRVRFEIAPGAGYGGENFDLVTMFDCLHDMGDSVGAARHVLETLAPHGTWMIVEPAAGDRVEDNLNPIGRASTGSRRCCAPPRRCPRTSAWRSERTRSTGVSVARRKRVNRPP